MRRSSKTPSARRVVGLRVQGRVHRAVLTPDRKVGGYTVRVPELPGCVTEGDTLEEAKRMAREAIALWLGTGEGPRTRWH
jgi:predicted RNase H-like HicB family nuclease